MGLVTKDGCGMHHHQDRLLESPPLLALLADGEPHSGARLALDLGQTRAAVRAGILRLRAAGIAVRAIPGRGYALPEAVELLDTNRLLAPLDEVNKARLSRFELLFEVDSTNSRLLSAAPPPPGMVDVCLSELQHAGRGRQGRRWFGPFGGGLAMSIGWCCSDVAGTLPNLSLGVGVAVSRALKRAGAEGILLKWPNDIWFRDRKVGGILTEVRAADAGVAHASAHVVIGIGINVSLTAAARRDIESGGMAVAAVADACTLPPSRNSVAGTILDELLSMLTQYQRSGFAAFRADWTALDALNGRQAQVVLGGAAVSGIARGVDVDGALLLETGGRMQRFVSGEASLRLTRG
jgi:BirA family biotin operon repressor/biotin-[acetyl-CoA-carboxylase] ligase